MPPTSCRSPRTARTTRCVLTLDQCTTFDSSDNTIPRFTPEARQANHALVDLLGTIAQRKNATPAQMALAWLLAPKVRIVVIPGTRSPFR